MARDYHPEHDGEGQTVHKSGERAAHSAPHDSKAFMAALGGVAEPGTKSGSKDQKPKTGWLRDPKKALER